LGDGLGVENVFRLRRHRHVDGDEVGAGEKIREIVGELDLQAAGAALHEVGIVGDDVHAKGDGAAGDFATDAAHADDAEGLAAEFRALK
jgi:hypothetical protein